MEGGQPTTWTDDVTIAGRAAPTESSSGHSAELQDAFAARGETQIEVRAKIVSIQKSIKPGLDALGALRQKLDCIEDSDAEISDSDEDAIVTNTKKEIKSYIGKRSLKNVVKRNPWSCGNCEWSRRAPG